MVPAQGNRVTPCRELLCSPRRSKNEVIKSPRLGHWGSINRANVVVWFPNHFSPPADATCDFFNNWLAEQPNRTLIYVGRDFDARSAYWQRMLQQRSPSEELAIRQRLARSKAAWASHHAALPVTESSKWFTVYRRRHTTPRVVNSRLEESNDVRLGGPLTEEIASDDHQLTISDRMKAKKLGANVETWLSLDDQPLIASFQMTYWHNSRLLLVTNASPLLNLSMVQPAQQRLAAELVKLCGRPGRCVFLISKQNEPVLASEAANHHLIQILTTPPFSAILMHMAAMGLVYCFAVYPIFGRVRKLESNDETDFGRHVEALGRLLAKANNSEHADLLRHDYQQLVSGQSREPQVSKGAGDNPFRELHDREPNSEVTNAAENVEPDH